MPTRTAIAYYVTSHGYGHLNRSAAVIESLPAGVHVVIKTHPDLFGPWKRSLSGRYELLPGVFDCGAVHPRGESSLVDPQATLRTYERVHGEALKRVDDEVRFVREGRFDVVVSDIASLPLVVARRAGLPSVLVCNFTWYDIFRAYARSTRTHGGMLREMRREYAEATVMLRAAPAMQSTGCKIVREVGLIARSGKKRRAELNRELGLDPRSRVIYVYVGRYGQSDMAWESLSRLRDFEFVSYDAVEGFPNWHQLDPERWPPRDLAASVDAMMAKAGYGTVTDAMASRTCLVFPPRFGFAEHRVLASGLRRWGGGIDLGTRDFKELRWRGALQRACEMAPGRPPWPIDGARRAARAIMQVAE